ncbi:L-aspartate oxidase [Bacillus sp. NTK071]|nr:L-aspartate oxidase [Bacillus sp. NTK071]
MAADLLSTEKNVTIITKSELGRSNSRLAQGGIAAVTTEDDSWTNHFFDTIRAGVFHNNEELTELLVRQGPKQIQQLVRMGVQFDKNANGQYERGMEGAHSVSRILHSGGDATGMELVNTLICRVKERCTILENHLAIDLLKMDEECYGAHVMNETGEMITITAAYTILATGGAGQLYSVTSNDTSVTGDGIAIAYRAGAVLSDLEFMQFHPTMFASNGSHPFLISEAVRGEGAILLTGDGKRLMEGIHDQLELAPRDVVARTIAQEESEVYLDISMIKRFIERFPTISKLAEQSGVLLHNGKIPVKAGAHFLMGGVATDRYGRTSLPGLFALGEVANTGVHGANRLASNSLLEGVVFANESANWILQSNRKFRMSFKIDMRINVSKNMLSINHLREVMDRQVGICRSSEGLTKAIRQLDWRGRFVEACTKEEIVHYNMLQTSWLMATSALMRTESRGGHFREDYPYQKQSFKQKRLIRRISQDDWVEAQERSGAIFH